MANNLSAQGDHLNDPVMKVYVLPKDDRETPARVEALRRIAEENQARAETSEGADQKIRVVVRGAMRVVVNAAATVKKTEGLKDVFASELLGDHEQRPTGSQE